MPLSPHTDNYSYGKGVIYFKPEGSNGMLDLGNCPSFNANVEISKNEHFSSRKGTKVKDKVFVSQKAAKFALTMEEFSPENLAIALMGETVKSSEAAAVLDGQEVTAVPDRFVELGARDLRVTRIAVTDVAGAPFDDGETITGDTSAATAKVAWAGDGYLECVNVVGEFQAGETLTGGTSSATANVGGVELREDVVCVDAADPTVRYEPGVDYDLNPRGGLLRVRSGGSIGESCFVSADAPAHEVYRIDALTEGSITGEILFIGDPDEGPKHEIRIWKASLTTSGEVSWISDEQASIPVEIECQDDSLNHPACPFFEVRQIA